MSKVTKLTSVYQQDLWSAPTILSGEQDQGGNIAIAIMPEPPGFCCILRLLIPEGVTPVVQKWGVKEKQRVDAGAHWCWPFYRHIVYLISTKFILYNCPVKKVPTNDNVRINIDVSLVFQIGPDIEQVNDFCYKLGVARFDETLGAMTDELIRTMVLKVRYQQVYDLKESWSGQVLEALQDRFKEFGVNFWQCKITNVALPDNLAQTLQKATEFDSKIPLQQKKLKQTMASLKNKETRSNLELQLRQECEKEDMKLNCERVLLQREVKLTEAQKVKALSVTEAQQGKETLVGKANNEKEVVDEKCNTEAEKQMGAAKVKRDTEIYQIEQQFEVNVMDAESELAKVQLVNEGYLEECEAENQVKEQMAERRKHHLNMAKSSVLELLARNGKLVIGGDTGEYLLKNLVSGP